MLNLAIKRPDATEYAPSYGQYVSLVAGADIIASLEQQLDETLALLKSVSKTMAAFRYQPDKWSAKQLIGHVIDTERVFSYRALRFARGDETELPGFEGDDYVNDASFDEPELDDLAAELEHVRRATISLFRHLGSKAWNRRGVASGNEVSVRALAYIIAGHELHHREILINRYLTN